MCKKNKDIGDTALAELSFGPRATEAWVMQADCYAKLHHANVDDTHSGVNPRTPKKTGLIGTYYLSPARPRQAPGF